MGTDSASFDLIMDGVDNGATELIDNVSGATANFNQQLADLAKKEKAALQLDKLKEQLEGLTQAEKDALIATDAEMQALQEENEKAAQFSEGVQSAGLSMTDLNSAVMLGKQIFSALEQGYDATIGKSQAYAESIRNLSQISGQGAENTSRFVQVLDDFQIGADDVEAAMRKLTANGLVPNFESISKLATEYQAIQDPLAKNEFLVKNLGRASAGYTNLLSQNTDELRKNFDSVDTKLILTEEDIKKSEQLRLMEDKLSDSVNGLAVATGKALVPAMESVVNFLQGGVDGFNIIVDSVGRYNDINLKTIEILKSQGLANVWMSGTETGLTAATDAQIQSAHDLAIKQLDLAASTDNVVKSYGPYKPTAEDIAASNKTLSDSYVAIMGIQGQIVSQQNSFQQSSADLVGQQADVSAKLQEALAQGWWPTSDKVVQLQQQYSDLGVKAQELATKNKDAMNQIAASAADAKFATDGWTTAEFNASEQIKVGLGLITQAQADAAIKTNDLAAAVASGQITVQEFTKAVSDGSLEVKSKNDISGKSWEEYAGLIKTNVDESTKKIDEGTAKVGSYADATKEKSDVVMDSWKNMDAATQTSVNDMIGDIQRWVDALDAVPAAVNVDLMTTPAPALPGTQSAFGAQAIGGGNITIVGGTFYISAENQITEQMAII